MKVKLAFLGLVASVVFASHQASAKSFDEVLEYLRTKPSYHESLNSVDDLANIETVSIMDGNIVDTDFAFLAELCQFNKVTWLDLRFNRLTGAGFKILAERCGTWDSIQYVDLGGNPLDDEHLKLLSMFPNLVSLNIDFHDEGGVSQVTGDFLKTYFPSKLKSFWATDTRISDDNALLIAKWPALEIFNLRGVQLSEDVLALLNAEKINAVAKPWDIRRLQYEIKRAQFSHISWDHDEVMEDLALALKEDLISREAYNWAVENEVGVVAITMRDDKTRIFGAFERNKSDSLNKDEL